MVRSMRLYEVQTFDDKIRAVRRDFIKESSVISFSLFEKGYMIAPKKWYLGKNCVWYLDEVETARELAEVKSVYLYPSLSRQQECKHYFLYRFSFIDTIKYRIWHKAFVIQEKRRNKIIMKNILKSNQGAQLEYLAKSITKDIEKAMSEVQEDITKAKDLIERMEF